VDTETDEIVTLMCHRRATEDELAMSEIKTKRGILSSQQSPARSSAPTPTNPRPSSDARESQPESKAHCTS